MSLIRAFLLSLVVGLLGVVVYAWLGQQAPRPNLAGISHPLLGGVAVRDQISLADVATVRSQGFRILIDLRPDGEAPDQPPSSAVAEAAGKAGIGFAYIPTPQGEVPDALVDQLATVLASAQGPVLLYCRSGNRAARVWALAEASRANGPSATQIVAAVRLAGQSVDDLLPRIEAGIAARKKL